MPFARLLVLLVAALCVSTPLHAQRARYGIAVGKSFIGGGDSRTLIDINGDTATGAGRDGLHLRAFAEIPLSSPSFAFRGELFYNRLTSGSNTWAIVNGDIGKEALVDRTIGLTGSFIGALKPHASVSPYFLLGAGIFASHLGHNPDPQSNKVVSTRGGMGLGVQTGAGLRFRMGQRNLLLEWRYNQALNNMRG